MGYNSKELKIFDLFLVIVKRKKTFLAIIFSITIIGAVLAFIWPKSYKAEISFIVTDGNSVNFSSGGILSGLANLSVNGSNVTSDQALILLRSKEIQDKVIAEFNLSEVYGTEIPEALRKSLDNSILIEEKREGGLGFNNIIAITITYIEEDPKRALELIKYYYGELENKVEDLNKQNVADGYLLLKSRLKQNEIDLRVAEDSLVSYQTRHGILAVEEQAKAQIIGIAEIKSEIVKLEVEIGYLEEVLGENSSKINDLKLQKKEFEKKYNQIVQGDNLDDATYDIFQSVSEMPALYIEYLRRYREVIVQEEIYKVLYPQFEQQKLNYEEVNSGLRVIEPAILPTYKDGPKRAYIIIAAFLASFFIALLYVFIKEWKEDLKKSNIEEYNRIKQVLIDLKTWK